MNWYAAHLIEYMKFRDGVQDKYPFYENVILIEADSSDEAWEKAEQYGKDNEIDDESVTWGGRPAQQVFAGVRKIMSPAGSEDLSDSPKHGTEITYSQMVIDKKEDFLNYVDNEPATVYSEE